MQRITRSLTGALVALTMTAAFAVATPLASGAQHSTGSTSSAAAADPDPVPAGPPTCC